MKMKFDFNDITLVPEIITSIKSRDDVNPFDGNNMLPLFTAPMDTVIDRYNYHLFKNMGINVCTPRNEPVWDTSCFESMSQKEFEHFLTAYKVKYFKAENKKRVLIDVANGHMESLYNMTKEFCENKYSDKHKLMIGNIANPKTFRKYAELNVDYVRVGIGGGSACLTSANTGVHYPMASLIEECYKIKKELGSNTNIVADGGFRNFDEIIKALAIGADYVMIGGILNKTLESCSEIKLFDLINISHQTAEKLWEKYPIIRKYMYKSFRGMSTKEVQKKWNRNKLRTSEGIVKSNKVEYRLEKWVDNFKDYLKSAMSYTNSTNLSEFKESDYILITENALHRFKK
jgi:IMP dehydrogenase/GMP reductase